MILEVKVIPQARQNAVVEFKEGILKIKIKGTPVKGKVNENLIKFLAEILGVPKAQIRIISGLTNPRKRIEIAGLKNIPPEVLRSTPS
jgi:uncharacterized protein (TIGR00251 family)